MRLFFAFVLASAAYGSAFGCGSTTTSGDVIDSGPADGAPADGTPTDGTPTDTGADTGLSPDDACTAYAAAYCDKATSCVSFYVQINWGDAATCKARLKDACLRSIKAPGSGISSPAIDKCLKAIPAVTCSDFLNGVPIADCQITGTTDDGKACGDNSQCKSGFCATDNSKSTCGTCSPRSTAGGACVANDCSDGLKCTVGKCQKPAKVGETCGADVPCGSQLSCVGGKCVAQITTEGAACDDKEVKGPKCDFTKTLACIADKCQKFAFATTGAACGIVVEGTPPSITVKSVTLCDKSGYCNGVDIPSFKLVGTCAAVSPDGGPCVAGADPFKGPGCLPPAKCIDNVCKLGDPAACK